MSLIHRLVNLRCKDYGYDCEFEVKGNTDQVLREFSSHFSVIHGIEYEIGVLDNFIRRKFS